MTAGIKIGFALAGAAILWYGGFLIYESIKDYQDEQQKNALDEIRDSWDAYQEHIRLEELKDMWQVYTNRLGDPLVFEDPRFVEDIDG